MHLVYDNAAEKKQIRDANWKISSLRIQSPPTPQEIMKEN